MRADRTLRLLVVLLLAAMTLCGWSLLHAQSIRRAAADAAARTDQCAKAAEALQLRSAQPQQATLVSGATNDLVTRVERAAADAGIGPELLIRVAPEAPRRLGALPYAQVDQQVQLRAVTLTQVAALAERVCAQDALLTTSIRLSAPRDQPGTSETWNADLTFSLLTDAPAELAKRSNP